jgi:YVTN family beta-propeller protein
MKKFFKYFIFVFTGVLFLQGCSRDELTGPGGGTVSDRGVYVLSEGNGTSSSIALSYYNITDTAFTQNILSQNIGSFPDGLIASGNQLYITSQGNFGSPGKIYRMDLTGNVQGSNDVGINPYSLTEASDKLYITNGPASNVSVVDKNSLSLITTIPVGVYPQEIITFGTKVFLCNTSAFGGPFDSTVSVIDAPTDQVVASIPVQRDPSSLAISNSSRLIVGCPGNNSYIYLIDPTSYAKLDSFQVSDGCNRDIAVDRDSDDIYFISGTVVGSTPQYRVLKLNLSTRTITEIFPIGPIYYGLAYDSQSDQLFVAITPDFSNNGKLRVLTGGTTVDYTTGVAPRRLLIK